MRAALGVKAVLLAVIPTLVRARQVTDREMVASLVETYGRDHVAVPIPASVRVKESPGLNGQTLFEYANDSVPAAAYWSLVGKVEK